MIHLKQKIEDATYPNYKFLVNHINALVMTHSLGTRYAVHTGVPTHVGNVVVDILETIRSSL